MTEDYLKKDEVNALKQLLTETFGELEDYRRQASVDHLYNRYFVHYDMRCD